MKNVSQMKTIAISMPLATTRLGLFSVHAIEATQVMELTVQVRINFLVSSSPVLTYDYVSIS